MCMYMVFSSYLDILRLSKEDFKLDYDGGNIFISWILVDYGYIRLYIYNIII